MGTISNSVFLGVGRCSEADEQNWRQGCCCPNEGAGVQTKSKDGIYADAGYSQRMGINMSIFQSLGL